MAVRHPGDTVVVDRNGLETGQTLRHQDALGEADVRELERRDQVTDGGDGRDVRAHVLVDQDVAAVDRDALLLVAQALRDRTAADRDEQHLGLELLAVGEGDLDAVGGVLGLREEGAQVELDAALAERALKQLGGVLVLERGEVLQTFDDRDVRTEGLPRGGELDADDAAAEHDRGLRNAVQDQRVVRGDDAVAVDLQARQRLRHGAGREEHVAALDALAVHVDRRRGGEAALTLDVRHLAGGDEPLQALVQARDDPVLVLVDGCHVDALEGGLDTELLAFAGLVGDLTRVQQSLGRNAPTVQAGTADLVLFDQGDVQTQLGSAQRRGVTAATAAENH